MPTVQVLLADSPPHHQLASDIATAPIARITPNTSTLRRTFNGRRHDVGVRKVESQWQSIASGRSGCSRMTPTRIRSRKGSICTLCSPHPNSVADSSVAAIAMTCRSNASFGVPVTATILASCAGRWARCVPGVVVARIRRFRPSRRPKDDLRHGALPDASSYRSNSGVKLQPCGAVRSDRVTDVGATD